PTKLDEDIVAAQRELEEKRQRFTDQHPDVVAAKQKLAQLRAERAREAVAPPPSGGPSELSDAEQAGIRVQLQRIQSMMGEGRDKTKVGTASGAGAVTRNEGESIVRVETEWSRLQRDVQEARERNKQLEDLVFRANLIVGAEEVGGAAQLLVVD